MNNDIVIVLLSAVLATLNPSLLAAMTVMLLLPQSIPRSQLKIIEGEGHGGPTTWERVRLALG